jgi:hypothetical protein
MKTTEDSVTQSGTAEQGIAEEEAPGMEAKSKELVEKKARRFTRRCNPRSAAVSKTSRSTFEQPA